MSFEFAALGAAFSWAVGGLIAQVPVRALGGPRFTRVRMYWVSFALVVIATFVGGWRTLDPGSFTLLSLSGVFGLALGDAALFSAFYRIGPRRTGILFAANAPMAAVISAIIFGERFSVATFTGSALVTVGVIMAIAFGTRRGHQHHWENVEGSIWVGVGFGLLGALGQAVAVLLADPAFSDGDLNTWAGAAVRAVVGTIALLAMKPLFDRRNPIPADSRISLRLWGVIIVSGTIGMVVGKTLVLVALTEGDPGIVSVLVSTAPVIQLPLIWLVTRELPAAGAWLGALAAAIGTAAIVA
jgi:drug/metabolite transporter (DMT)-like permease